MPTRVLGSRCVVLLPKVGVAALLFCVLSPISPASSNSTLVLISVMSKSASSSMFAAKRDGASAAAAADSEDVLLLAKACRSGS